MKKTKAAFRAIREDCGLSQQDVADEAGVNVRSVKRWENDGIEGYMPPDDVWQFLLAARGALYEDARTISDQMIESLKNGSSITLFYNRTQPDLDEVQLDEGIDEPVGYANARLREIARLLDTAEAPYVFEFK